MIGRYLIKKLKIVKKLSRLYNSAIINIKLSKNLLDKLIKYMQKIDILIIKTNSKIYKPKTYNKVDNNLVN